MITYVYIYIYTCVIVYQSIVNDIIIFPSTLQILGMHPIFPAGRRPAAGRKAARGRPTDFD